MADYLASATNAAGDTLGEVGWDEAERTYVATCSGCPRAVRRQRLLDAFLWIESHTHETVPAPCIHNGYHQAGRCPGADPSEDYMADRPGHGSPS